MVPLFVPITSLLVPTPGRWWTNAPPRQRIQVITWLMTYPHWPPANSTDPICELCRVASLVPLALLLGLYLPFGPEPASFLRMGVLWAERDG